MKCRSPASVILSARCHITRPVRTTPWKVLLTVACGAMACDGDRAVKRASRELANSLRVTEPQQVTDTPQAADTGRPQTMLTIDGSRSMAGFAGCNTPTQFDMVLDRLTSYLSFA